MLLICDGDRPVALAGIMGGMNSEVTDTTTTVLLESACFNPVSIRKTARRLNLATDASYRFERGVDPEGVCNALDRAVQLFCELAGGIAEDAGRDVYLGKVPFKSLTLRISRTSALLGIDLDAARSATSLRSIGIRCKHKDADTLWISPPSFRVDIEREADLIEEVARLYGYNNIPVSLPEVHLSYPEQDSSRLKRTRDRRLLTGIGFSEAINYSFTNEKYLDLLQLAEDDRRRQDRPAPQPAQRRSGGDADHRSCPACWKMSTAISGSRRPRSSSLRSARSFIHTSENSQPEEGFRLAGVLSGNRHGYSLSPAFQGGRCRYLRRQGGGRVHPPADAALDRADGGAAIELPYPRYRRRPRPLSLPAKPCMSALRRPLSALSAGSGRISCAASASSTRSITSTSISTPSASSQPHPRPSPHCRSIPRSNAISPSSCR